MSVERQTRALLDLVEADRARQCAQILGEARVRATALRRQAQAEALARLRQAFESQRHLSRQRLAAAQAQLATQRRLQAQQRTAALLQLAWQQLPAALQARWQQADARAAWVREVLASARDRLPRGPWQIAHAPDWPAAEQQALAPVLATANGAAPVFEADPRIKAGIRIAINGNRIDGTLDGLLADRAAVDARLLHHLESTP
ncbi:MAG: hypothetical protein Q7U26_11995 [Aquabacterium sp.]|nr:hypothetical protein [Aquabacterium sp.]